MKKREERLVQLFDRVRRLAAEDNPLQQSDVTVSMPQLNMLEWVAAHARCHLGELAEGLSVSVPTVSVGVRRLEGAGLLSRLPDPSDGRVIRLELTGPGRKLVDRAHAFKLEKMSGLLSGLRPEEQVALLELLGKAVLFAEGRQKRTGENRPGNEEDKK